MPTYRDPETGTRYWFETEPTPGTIRANLVPMTDEEAAAAEDQAVEQIEE